MSWVITPNFTQWTPALITTALWLDAADASTVTTVSSAVSQWNDKSGNSRNVSQATGASQPAYDATGFNGKGALTFDGSNNFLQSAASITTGTYTQEFNVYWVATRSSNGGSILTERSSTLVASNSWSASGGANFISSDGLNLASNNTISNATLGTIQASGGLVFHRHQPGQRDILFVNGTQATVLAGTASNITGGTSHFRIGAREGNVGFFWNGQICEVIVILSNPSTLDRQKTEGYLAHKWGLTASLPADHPYKVTPPAP
jgi:hypothetical protein